MADRRDVHRNLAIGGFPVGSDKRERGIAAHHLAVIDIQDATARAVHRMHFDFVKSLQHLIAAPVLTNGSTTRESPGFTGRQPDAVRLVP